MDKDFWIGLLGLTFLTVLSFGTLFGSYKYGRYMERRELTAELKRQVEEIYIEGIGDGYKKAKKDLKDNCDNIPLTYGRY